MAAASDFERVGDASARPAARSQPLATAPSAATSVVGEEVGLGGDERDRRSRRRRAPRRRACAVERGGAAVRVGRVVGVQRERRRERAQRGAQRDDGVGGVEVRDGGAARRRGVGLVDEDRCAASKCSRSRLTSAPSGSRARDRAASPRRRGARCRRRTDRRRRWRAGRREPPTSGLFASVSANSWRSRRPAPTRPRSRLCRRDGEGRRLRKIFPRSRPAGAAPPASVTPIAAGHQRSGERVVVVERLLRRREAAEGRAVGRERAREHQRRLVVHLVEHREPLPPLERHVAEERAFPAGPDRGPALPRRDGSASATGTT